MNLGFGTAVSDFDDDTVGPTADGGLISLKGLSPEGGLILIGLTRENEKGLLTTGLQLTAGLTGTTIYFLSSGFLVLTRVRTTSP